MDFIVGEVWTLRHLDIETFGLSEIPLVDFKAALRYVRLRRTTQGPHLMYCI
jgi:hypothetical protein